jgi:phosphoribosyl-AMP cyclohydrolase/phosphoribosyl-ATP pyrophosphohydrolase/phosphoribosyl-AMP cyclohydrolase
MPGPHPLDATPDQLGAIRYDGDGLIPAIIQDDSTGEVLMMAWMTAESLALTLSEGRTVFWSRSRQELWRKGETSGNRQWVRSGAYDCDGDVLLFRVAQEGEGACHTGKVSCFHNWFGPDPGPETETIRSTPS